MAHVVGTAGVLTDVIRHRRCPALKDVVGDAEATSSLFLDWWVVWNCIVEYLSHVICNSNVIFPLVREDGLYLTRIIVWFLFATGAFRDDFVDFLVNLLRVIIRFWLWCEIEPTLEDGLMHWASIVTLTIWLDVELAPVVVVCQITYGAWLMIDMIHIGGLADLRVLMMISVMHKVRNIVWIWRLIISRHSSLRNVILIHEEMVSVIGNAILSFNKRNASAHISSAVAGFRKMEPVVIKSIDWVLLRIIVAPITVALALAELWLLNDCRSPWVWRLLSVFGLVTVHELLHLSLHHLNSLLHLINL